MKKTDFPTAPLVLAFVLGPLLEQAVRRSLIISQGDISIFVTRPWAIFFLVITALLALGPLVLQRISTNEPSQEPNQDKESDPDREEEEVPVTTARKDDQQ
jgi:TctA family transporter